MAGLGTKGPGRPPVGGTGGKGTGGKKKKKKGHPPSYGSQYVTVIINRQCAYELLVALTQALGTPSVPKKGKKKKKKGGKKKGGKGKGGKGKGGK